MVRLISSSASSALETSVCDGQGADSQFLDLPGRVFRRFRRMMSEMTMFIAAGGQLQGDGLADAAGRRR